MRSSCDATSLIGSRPRQCGGCCPIAWPGRTEGTLRTVLVLLHSTTAVVLQGKMAQHTCSPSRVVIGFAAREQECESGRHVVALMCKTVWVDSVGGVVGVAAAAVVEQKSLLTLCMVQVKEPCCCPSRCRCWRSGR